MQILLVLQLWLRKQKSRPRFFTKNYGIENRNIYQYKIGKTQNNVAFGARYYTAETQRQQIGKGTTRSDFDLTVKVNRETLLSPLRISHYSLKINLVTPNLV
jgi:hypothetical protein